MREGYECLTISRAIDLLQRNLLSTHTGISISVPEDYFQFTSNK